MTNAQIISWIFLAIAVSSQKEPASFSGISQIADGINHAVPTQKEMQYSISYLKKENLISKNENKYSLTEAGKKIFAKAEKKTKILLKLWEELEKEFTNI